MKQVMICTISHEMGANYLPLLDNAIKPSHLVIYHSDIQDMRRRAQSLKEYAVDKGIEVKLVKCSNAHNYQISLSEAKALLEKYQNDHVLINITGGTKMTALAFAIACEQMQAKHIRAFYYDVNQNQISYLDDQTVRDLDIQNFDLLTLIKLYQFGYLGHKTTFDDKLAEINLASSSGFRAVTPDNMYALYQQMVEKHISSSDDLYAQWLSAILPAKEQKPIPVTAELKKNPFFKIFESNGYAKIVSGRLQFPSTIFAQFVAGGDWFEDYCLRQIRDVACQESITNIMTALNYTRTARDIDGTIKEVSNDIDLCFYHRNTSYVGECKTTNYRKKSAKNNDDIYRLESHGIAGVRVRKILFSFYPPSENGLTRAKGTQISILYPQKGLSIAAQLAQLLGQ